MTDKFTSKYLNYFFSMREATNEYFANSMIGCKSPHPKYRPTRSQVIKNKQRRKSR